MYGEKREKKIIHKTGGPKEFQVLALREAWLRGTTRNPRKKRDVTKSSKKKKKKTKKKTQTPSCSFRLLSIRRRHPGLFQQGALTGMRGKRELHDSCWGREKGAIAKLLSSGVVFFLGKKRSKRKHEGSGRCKRDSVEKGVRMTKRRGGEKGTLVQATARGKSIVCHSAKALPKKRGRSSKKRSKRGSKAGKTGDWCQYFLKGATTSDK